jgi:hypothetical protein
MLLTDVGMATAEGGGRGPRRNKDSGMGERGAILELGEQAFHLRSEKFLESLAVEPSWRSHDGAG